MKQPPDFHDQHEAMEMCRDCGCPRNAHDPTDDAMPMRCNTCSCLKFVGSAIQMPTVHLDETTLADLKEALAAEPLAPVVEIKSVDPMMRLIATAEQKHGFAPGGLAAAATPLRAQILRKAEHLTCGDRHVSYGDPVENHERIAALWAPILGIQPTAAQVALCMTQVKVARLITNPTHHDSQVDGAAYFAISGECAEAERARDGDTAF